MCVFFSGTRHQTPHLHTKNKHCISTDPQQQRATNENSKRVFRFCLYPDRCPSHNNPCELRGASSIIAQLVHWAAACFLRRMKRKKWLFGRQANGYKKRAKERASEQEGPTNSISFLPSHHGAPVN